MGDSLARDLDALLASHFADAAMLTPSARAKIERAAVALREVEKERDAATAQRGYLKAYLRIWVQRALDAECERDRLRANHARVERERDAALRAIGQALDMLGADEAFDLHGGGRQWGSVVEKLRDGARRVLRTTLGEG